MNEFSPVVLCGWVFFEKKNGEDEVPFLIFRYVMVIKEKKEMVKK